MKSLNDLIAEFEDAVQRQYKVAQNARSEYSEILRRTAEVDECRSALLLALAAGKTLSRRVDDAVQQMGGYWPVDKIEDRLVEEVGEIFKERNKGTPAGKIREAGDLLFTNLAYLNAQDVDVEQLLIETIAASLAKAVKGKPDGSQS